MIRAEQIDKEILERIAGIINRGNTCEVKKEKGQIVVVEIQRKVVIKTSPIGATG